MFLGIVLALMSPILLASGDPCGVRNTDVRPILFPAMYRYHAGGEHDVVL